MGVHGKTNFKTDEIGESKMKCPKCEGLKYVYSISGNTGTLETCPICKGTGKVERTDGIDYNRKIAVPEHKAGQTGG